HRSHVSLEAGWIGQESMMNEGQLNGTASTSICQYEGLVRQERLVQPSALPQARKRCAPVRTCCAEVVMLSRIFAGKYAKKDPVLLVLQRQLRSLGQP